MSRRRGLGFVDDMGFGDDADYVGGQDAGDTMRGYPLDDDNDPDEQWMNDKYKRDREEALRRRGAQNPAQPRQRGWDRDFYGKMQADAPDYNGPDYPRRRAAWEARVRSEGRRRGMSDGEIEDMIASIYDEGDQLDQERHDRARRR